MLMTPVSKRFRQIVTVLFVGCIAGCSGAVTSRTPDTTPHAVTAGPRLLPPGIEFTVPHAFGAGGTLRHSQARHRVFLSDAALNVVTIFGRASQIRQLSGFYEPQGITTDGQGTLYVANTEAQNVEEFSPPYKGVPRLALSESNQFPIDVAVSPAGMVAVLNICAGYGSRCTGAGNVSFYADRKAITPCAVVSAGNKIRGYCLALSMLRGRFM